MTHPDTLIQKYLVGKLAENKKDELLDQLLKGYNELMSLVRKWRKGHWGETR